MDRILVRPEFRESVEQLMRGQWREPVIALRLDENCDPGFDVPGRRLDGTVKGKRLVRRFFWNIARGMAGLVINVFMLFTAGGVGNPFRREIRVTGPADAMALDLLDKLRRAKGPWLVCSPSSLAVVDTGSTYMDPADAEPPRILWQAREPQCPEINLRTHAITWPDGSKFKFPLYRSEGQHLQKYYGPSYTIDWHGRSGSGPE
ncbi:hypothetical protein [Actinoallomurus iriomotensis]|uniref:Uncharacterized protein n=1 Tax=Actinoallomurus iriomotensis TaxID=478107 RepID=A0A9W6VRE6_9ACTN|nr:hypothetical protein [Actinoallomurus iriomotensis]GLY82163.1 hypothetical protein Airi02_000950 [Actinoallomurus iriomotensis]